MSNTSTPSASGAVGLPEAVPPANHGRTPAAWALVAIVTAGTVLATVAMIAAVTWLVVVGVVVVVLGIVVGVVLRAVGLGQTGERAASGHHGR